MILSVCTVLVSLRILMINKRERHPGVYILALIGLCIFFGILAQLLAVLILPLFQDGSFYDNLMEIVFSPSALENLPVNALKFVQMFTMAVMFIIPAIIISRWKDGSAFGIYNLNKGPESLSLFIGIAAFACFIPLISYLGWLNMQMVLPESLSWLETILKEMEEMSAGMIEKFLLNVGPLGLLVNLFMIAILPGFAEELIFRGGFQKFFQSIFENRWNWNIGGHVAVWLVAIFFSFVHFQFYGFLPRFILGVILGYLFLFSKNLWYPIIGHAVFNGVQVVLAYFMPEEMLNQDIESIQMPIWAALISLALGSSLLLYFKNNVQIEVDSNEIEYIAEENYEGS